MFDTESRPTLKLEALPYGTAVAMFRAMFGSSYEATLLTRPAGDILAANAEACAVFGASEDALVERSRVDAHLKLADVSDPRLAALVAERAARGRARGGVRLQRIDGSPFEAEVSSFLFLDEAGLATSVLTVRDLTPVRLAERDARDSAQRLSFSMDAAEIGDWDMDLRTTVTHRSRRHDQCFGYQSPPAKWDYPTFLAHIDPADRARVDACHQAGLAAGGDHDVEFRVTWPDGSLHWLWSRGRVHCDDDGRPVRLAGIVLDVTVRKQLMEAQSARLAAEAANRAKSEFLSRMSHELRTPLNAVLGFSQLLATSLNEPLSARQLRQVKHIEQGGWHLLNMVDEVLDLSRIDSGHARVKEELVEVATLLRECTGLLQATADARAIELVCSPDPATLAVAGDRTRVKQILLNLLGNAIKYTQAGGRVSVASRSVDGERVELSVTDNGPGLSAAQQAQLFQPFNRLGQEDGPTPGTGIGLVISQRLAELMRGSLSVQSAPGLGCTFAVTLPAQALEASLQIAALCDQAMADAGALQQPGRVLYIEDNAANAELMQGFVAQRPLVDLEVQRTAKDGMAAAWRRQPDIILLDMQLPDLPGLDVLRRLRQHPMTAAVPVVVISASAMADSVAAATAAGAVDYLAKPLRLETLLATLDRCLPAACLP